MAPRDGFEVLRRNIPQYHPYPFVATIVNETSFEKTLLTGKNGSNITKIKKKLALYGLKQALRAPFGRFLK